MTSDKLNDFYEVDEFDHPITLAVNVGFGKNAISIVLLNNKMIYGPESDGSFMRSFEKILGQSRELNGKKLQLITLVLANEEKTYETSLVISLSGGPAYYAQKLEAYSPETNGFVKYSIGIRFCK